MLPAEIGEPRSGALPTHTCELRGHDSWRAELTAATKTTPPEGLLLILADRGLSQALLRFLSHGRWRRAKSASLRKLRAQLRESRFEVVAEYVIWPSSGSPRVALRAASFRALRWVQRSGVLGGGGNRLWARALARSALFTPLAYLLAPRVALVARNSAGSVE